MASLIDVEKWVEVALSHGDPRVKHWPLMDVRLVLALVVLYLVGIFVLVQIMKRKKEPFKLKWIPLIHNAHLCLLSLYMCVEVLRQAYLGGYRLFGNGIDSSEAGYGMARAIWIFYVSKVAEFGDTIIMALKKNFHQISFLHLYHHSSIFFIWWIVCFYAPGGESYFSAALNSFIHVLMYGYYFWTTVDGWKESDEEKAAKKAAKLAAATAAAAKANAEASGNTAPAPAVKVERERKPTPCEPAYYRQYITSMQMLQFSVMFIQACYNVTVDIPNYPRFLGWILFFYMLTMLGLFANFFLRAYCKPKSRGPKTSATTGAGAGAARSDVPKKVD